MPTWDTIGKVRMTPKGTFNSSSAYEVLDIVSNSANNKVYIAKTNVPTGSSLSDTAYWINILDMSNAYIVIRDYIATMAEARSYLGI